MPTKMNFRGIKNIKSASTIHQKYLLLNMWIGLNNILEGENYNLLLPLARFGQLAKCVQCYIGQICPSIHWTDLVIHKWHNMSTHRKDLILLFLLPSSFSPPPSLSPLLSLSDLLHATVISLQYYFTYITFYLITFELSEIWTHDAWLWGSSTNQ